MLRGDVDNLSKYPKASIRTQRSSEHGALAAIDTRIDLSVKWLQYRQEYLSYSASCPLDGDFGFDWQGQHFAMTFGFACGIADFIRVMLHLSAYLFVATVILTGKAPGKA